MLNYIKSGKCQAQIRPQGRWGGGGDEQTGGKLYIPVKAESDHSGSKTLPIAPGDIEMGNCFWVLYISGSFLPIALVPKAWVLKICSTKMVVWKSNIGGHRNKIFKYKIWGIEVTHVIFGPEGQKRVKSQRHVNIGIIFSLTVPSYNFTPAGSPEHQGSTGSEVWSHVARHCGRGFQPWNHIWGLALM